MKNWSTTEVLLQKSVSYINDNILLKFNNQLLNNSIVKYNYKYIPVVKISASLKFFAPGSTWTNEEKGALFLYFDGIEAAKNFVDATTDGSTTISDQNGIEYNFKPKSQHSEQYSGNNLPTHGYGPGNAKDSDEW